MSSWMPNAVWETAYGPARIRPWDGWFDHAASENVSRLQWGALSDPCGVRDAAGRTAWMVGVWHRPEWPLFAPPDVNFQACDLEGRNLWFYYLDGQGEKSSSGVRALEVLLDQTPMRPDAQGHGWWSVLLAGQAARNKLPSTQLTPTWLEVSSSLVQQPGAQETFWAAPEPHRTQRAQWMMQRAEESDLDHDNPSFGWEESKLVPALIEWSASPDATPAEQAAVFVLGLRGLARWYFDEAGLIALAQSMPLASADLMPVDFWDLLKLEHRVISQGRRHGPAQVCQEILQARQRAWALGESWVPSSKPASKQRF